MRGRGVLFIVFFGSCCLLAQTSTPTNRVDVVVSDSSGRPVTSLTKDSFLLFEDNQPRIIQNFTPAETPWNFVLLFDRSLTWLESGNYTQDRDYVVATWRRMAQSIDRFISQLNPQDRVTIAAFENKVELLMDWRNAKTGQELNVKLDPVLRPPDGVKDLHGATDWAIQKLQGARGRKAVILLTDGRDGRLAPQWLVNDERQEIFDPLFGLIDTAEAEDFLKTLETVQKSGVRFYFLAVNTTRPPEFRGRPISGLYPGSKEAVANYLSRGRVRLEKLAEVSNGRVLYGSGPDDAIAKYEKLYSEFMLGVRYTLEYSSARGEEDIPPGFEIRMRDEKLKAIYTGARR